MATQSLATVEIPASLSEWTDCAISLPGGLSENEWESIGETLGRMARASCWWIGDWINYGEAAGYVSREKYDRAEVLTGLRRDTLRHYAHVSRRIPIMDRDPSLTFKAHRLALGNGRQPAPPYEIRTERHRQIAMRSKERLERAVGSCNALARADFKIEAAAAAASPEERSGWDGAFRDAITALGRMRARIKEADGA